MRSQQKSSIEGLLSKKRFNATEMEQFKAFVCPPLYGHPVHGTGTRPDNIAISHCGIAENSGHSQADKERAQKLLGDNFNNENIRTLLKLALKSRNSEKIAILLHFLFLFDNQGTNNSAWIKQIVAAEMRAPLLAWRKLVATHRALLATKAAISEGETFAKLQAERSAKAWQAFYNPTKKGLEYSDDEYADDERSESESTLPVAIRPSATKRIVRVRSRGLAPQNCSTNDEASAAVTRGLVSRPRLPSDNPDPVALVRNINKAIEELSTLRPLAQEESEYICEKILEIRDILVNNIKHRPGSRQTFQDKTLANIAKRESHPLFLAVNGINGLRRQIEKISKAIAKIQKLQQRLNQLLGETDRIASEKASLLIMLNKEFSSFQAYQQNLQRSIDERVNVMSRLQGLQEILQGKMNCYLQEITQSKKTLLMHHVTKSRTFDGQAQTFKDLHDIYSCLLSEDNYKLPALHLITKDEYGQTPLHYVEQGDNTTMQSMLQDDLGKIASIHPLLEDARAYLYRRYSNAWFPWTKKSYYAKLRVIIRAINALKNGDRNIDTVYQNLIDNKVLKSRIIFIPWIFSFKDKKTDMLREQLKMIVSSQATDKDNDKAKAKKNLVSNPLKTRIINSITSAIFAMIPRRRRMPRPKLERNSTTRTPLTSRERELISSSLAKFQRRRRATISRLDPATRHLLPNPTPLLPIAEDGAVGRPGTSSTSTIAVDSPRPSDRIRQMRANVFAMMDRTDLPRRSSITRPSNPKLAVGYIPDKDRYVLYSKTMLAQSAKESAQARTKTKAKILVDDFGGMVPTALGAKHKKSITIARYVAQQSRRFRTRNIQQQLRKIDDSLEAEHPAGQTWAKIPVATQEKLSAVRQTSIDIDRGASAVAALQKMNRVLSKNAGFFTPKYLSMGLALQASEEELEHLSTLPATAA